MNKEKENGYKNIVSDVHSEYRRNLIKFLITIILVLTIGKEIFDFINENPVIFSTIVFVIFSVLLLGMIATIASFIYDEIKENANKDIFRKIVESHGLSVKTSNVWYVLLGSNTTHEEVQQYAKFYIDEKLGEQGVSNEE